MNAPTQMIHPDAVLESLLAKGGRSQRQGNLAKLHDVCRHQYEGGSRSFSISDIGRLCEAQGILKGRVLYNAASADYRALIEVWAAYAGPPALKEPKTLASHEYLLRIEDPAIRSIMQAVITERDKLKAQLNVMKAHTQVTVDRRPLGATVAYGTSAETTTLPTTAQQFTPSERDALQKAISPQFLEDQGWREGGHGEILNGRGRMLFEVGYTKAIRKALSG
ncbi:alpha/beta hydrolase [Paraburkholderia madseniana]|uniref:Alpha/beta hydrolase n=1 Tax=Paraburkholderia madseniana TaxID=2599607 RepID=A0A6N6WDG0_9BURK|nr:gamma-mobile-trio protein GmtX [Paraburkholderia madseniana]KAE8758677.1 alpha/beta hydrolase [Paraburkholderia madseniana]